MQITLEADYAVRIVLCLAENRHRMDAKAISEKTGVTLRFSLKILRKLAANKILVSFKGISGGYELALPPEQITLYSVIETVEGDFGMCRCKTDPDFVCAHNTGTGTPCKVQHIYDDITKTVKEKMQAVTFASLVNADCK